MSTEPDRHRNPTPDRDRSRYRAFRTDGDVVVYDRENPRAWIQSDRVVDVDHP